MSTQHDKLTRPLRVARAPLECCRDQRPAEDQPDCWVCNPKATNANKGRCRGCEGLIDPLRRGNPTRDELLAAGLAG